MAQIYYAGPLFTAAERAWNTHNAIVLRARLAPATVLLPQEFCAPFESSAKPDFAAIFSACVAQLESANAVLAILDGPDCDSGTAWEVGYAVAKRIPVIGLRTDLRPAEDGASNCMLSRSCQSVVATIDHAAAELARMVARTQAAAR
jgi:nucleoside 2-deoxyribosyltransferase